MSRRIWYLALGIEAMACIAFVVYKASFSGLFTAAMAFPFEQAGSLLRALSLPGGAGNAAAFAIYAAVCLIPAAVFLILLKKRGFRKEDLLLPLLSAVLFAVLYLMVNPGLIGKSFGGAGGEGAEAIGKAVLGGTVYSVLCGYLALRFLRLSFESSTQKLQNYMAVLLGALCVLCVYAVFGACLSRFLQSLATLRESNAGNEHLLGASYVFLALQFGVDSLPYLFDLLLVFAALRLLDQMRADRYSAKSEAAAQRLSRLCGTALTATVLANIGWNLLQLLFAKSLRMINSSVQVPVVSIAFMLAVLLLARFIAENKQLKDDNDLFI